MSTKVKPPSLFVNLKKGDQIGGYEVIRCLGTGPMSRTFHVSTLSQKKEFALRVMELEGISLEWMQRLETQTMLLKKISFCHIESILDSQQLDNLWYCLKDYIYDGDGRSCNLRRYVGLHGSSLSEFQIISILNQIITALKEANLYEDALHKGVSHGNLSPENILVAFSHPFNGQGSKGEASFEICLSDFQPYGLHYEKEVLLHYASLIGGDLSFNQKEVVNSSLLQIFKSYDYFSPEILQGAKPSSTSDIYSIGVIFYELLTGMIPSGRFPLPSLVRSNISPHWDQILSKCLQRDVKERYASLVELEEDFLQAFKEELKENSLEGKDLEDILQEKPQEKKERLNLTPKGMVYIPAGGYLVGNSKAGSDSLPVHEKETAGFYCDRTLVTNAQFSEFIRSTGYITTAEKENKAPLWVEGEWQLFPGISWKNPLGKRIPEDFYRHPVVQITLQDAEAYAKWRGRRLPTEEEWEYAAKGGRQEALYPWGSTALPNRAHFSQEGTCPVMNYPANGFGLYDIVGNVWEWTSSFYKGYPGNEKGSTNFGEKYKVVRGGCWMYDIEYCMVAFRNANEPSHMYPTVGFRTVREWE